MIAVGNGAERIETLNTEAGPYQGFDIEPSGELPKVENREPDEPRDMPTFGVSEEPVPKSTQVTNKQLKWH